MRLTTEEIDDLEEFVDGEEGFCFMNKSTEMARQTIAKLRRCIQSAENHGVISDSPEKVQRLGINDSNSA